VPTPLTSEKILSNVREWGNQFSAALDEAEKNAGPAGRIANTEIAFGNFLTAGLVVWRSGSSPAEDFNRALALIDSILEYISVRPQPYETFLATPTYLASLISFLMHGEIPLRYLQTLPMPADLPRRHRKLQDMTYLILLAWSLSSRSIPPEAFVVCEAPRAKRAQLSQETFRAHLNLLQDVIAGTDCESSLRIAEGLYDKRRRSGYYEGGLDYWGGGPMNPFVVDFEIAAILRLAEFLGRELPPSIHRWR
jgi:hypothetical protein